MKEENLALGIFIFMWAFILIGFIVGNSKR